MNATNLESTRHSWEITKEITSDGYTTPLAVQWVCRRCGLGKKLTIHRHQVKYSHGRYGAGPCPGSSDAL